MRQIQYLTQLLQQIIFKKKENKHDEARQQLRDAFQRLTKGHPKQFDELTLQETYQLFLQDETFASELALAVADLLVEEGQLLQDRSFSKSQKSFSQALLLYKQTQRDQSAAVPLDIQQKIAWLEEVVASSDPKEEIDRILSSDQ